MADLPETGVNNLNNPSKEIFQSCSGVYDGSLIGPAPYALDLPNSLNPNNFVAYTTPGPTTAPTLPPGNVNNALNNLNLSNGIRFVDDMLVFNPYIHYVGPPTTPIRTFNPQSFLQQSLASFNAYNFSNRTP